MKSHRVEVSSAGGPEVLVLRPWRVPALQPHEVLLKVSHAGVSFGDVMLRRHVFRDVPRPAVPGYDVVGTVEDANGHPLSRGDRVAAFVEYGGYAEHVRVPMASVVPLPDDVASEAASAVILNYPTAASMLEIAGARRGDMILVHGIRGGVGTAVADLARSRGLEVIGTTRAGGDGVATFGRDLPDLHERLRARAPAGFAAVFDGNARAIADSHRLLRRGGALVIFGLSAAAESSFAARLRLLRALFTFARLSLFGRVRRTTIFAIDKLFRRDPSRVRALVAEQIALLAAKAIRPVVGAVLPLTEAATAHDLLERGAVEGKIVLEVGRGT